MWKNCPNFLGRWLGSVCNSKNISFHYSWLVLALVFEQGRFGIIKGLFSHLRCNYLTLKTTAKIWCLVGFSAVRARAKRNTSLLNVVMELVRVYESYFYNYHNIKLLSQHHYVIIIVIITITTSSPSSHHHIIAAIIPIFITTYHHIANMSFFKQIASY